MKNYAQINEDGIVISVSQLSAEVKSDKLIPLETNDKLLLGMKYDSTTSTFIDAPLVEVIEEKVIIPSRVDLLELRIIELEKRLGIEQVILTK